jgi:hypothetical protein
MKLEELRQEQMKYYGLKEYKPEKLKLTKLNMDAMIPQLCFIIHYLNQHSYTLSHICLNDFEISENVLFLRSLVHMTEIDSNNSFIYKKLEEKEGICFPSNKLKDGQRASIYDTYASVGLFIYYIYYKKVKNELTEKDYGKLKGTKPYYFIKNTMLNHPCLVYL